MRYLLAIPIVVLLLGLLPMQAIRLQTGSRNPPVASRSCTRTTAWNIGYDDQRP